LTWVFNPTLVGDFRLGWVRGNYFTFPPNFGVDGPAAIGLKNVPSDPAIVGGVPKVNLQAFDAVGRHINASVPDSRVWNLRATLSLNRGPSLLQVRRRISIRRHDDKRPQCDDREDEL
jgi:hypothetical protein